MTKTETDWNLLSACCGILMRSHRTTYDMWIHVWKQKRTTYSAFWRECDCDSMPEFELIDAFGSSMCAVHSQHFSVHHRVHRHTHPKWVWLLDALWYQFNHIKTLTNIKFIKTSCSPSSITNWNGIHGENHKKQQKWENWKTKNNRNETNWPHKAEWSWAERSDCKICNRYLYIINWMKHGITISKHSTATAAAAASPSNVVGCQSILSTNKNCYRQTQIEYLWNACLFHTLTFVPVDAFYSIDVIFNCR